MKRVIALFHMLALLMFIVLAPAVSVVHASPIIMAAGQVTAGTYPFTGERIADGNTVLAAVCLCEPSSCRS